MSPDRNRHGQRQWCCKCDCGNEPVILQHSLVSGNTSRCDEHPKNEYVVVDDTVYLDVSTPSLPDAVSLIDVIDIGLVLNHTTTGGRMRWIAHNSNEEGHDRWGVYVSGTDRKTRLHRLIVGATGNSEIVDHINGNTLDNRRSNLRIITRAENNKNVRKRVTNTSGGTGVEYNPTKDNYTACIQLHGEKHYIGTFNTLELANTAYRAAAKVLGFSERHGL